MKKIDYDKPVKGRMPNDGWYLIALRGNFNPRNVFPARVSAVRCTAWVPDYDGGNERKVGQWRKRGWQFFRARLPRRGKGAKP